MNSIQDCTPGFTFGCDPEVFIFNHSGKPVCPTFIPGTKDEPFPVDGGALQRDGMAAEFNIDPASSFSEFNANISKVMAEMKKFLPKNHTIAVVPSVTFDQKEFDQSPDDAKELGCSPDFNAWTGSVNPPPNDPDNPYMRCAAGHIHYGWGEGFTFDDIQHIMNCQDLVKQLDWFLGGPSVRVDTDPTRRRLYGKAGAYRPKPYGVEYRVLSNYWITSRERRLEVWNRSQIAIAEMRRRFIPEKVRQTVNDLLIASINATTPSPGLAAYQYPLMTTDARLAVC